MNKLLIITAWPDYQQDSRSTKLKQLCKTYGQQASTKGIETNVLDLYKETDFQPVWYPEQELDSKTVEYQIRVQEAEHIAIFHPLWWGLPPAVLKGFLDKVFTSNFAYQIEQGELKPLLNKTMDVFVFSEKPAWQYRLLYRDLVKNFWEKIVCETSGMTLRRFENFGSFRNVNSQTIEKWEANIQKAAQKLNSKEDLLKFL